MELQLVRSFVELAQSRSLAAASARLGVTQSAVSLRISRLEEQLGTSLFLSNSEGYDLTPAGQEFLLYADKILALWQMARETISGAAPGPSNIKIGLEQGLWHKIGVPWLEAWRQSYPDISSDLRLGPSTWLHSALEQGEVEIAVGYQAYARPKIGQLLLGQERLILVSGQADVDLNNEYAALDWGEAFHSKHSQAFPHLSAPKTVLSVGELALDYIFHHGLCAYLPERLAAPFLAQNLLYAHPDQPNFDIEIWMSWRGDISRDILEASQAIMAKLFATIQ